MAFSFFSPKKFLGIDIGTSAIKVIELSKRGERKKLENYGEIQAKALYEKPFRTFEKSTLLLSSQDIARGIKAIIQEAKIKTKECIFSIPDFSSFFTTFELPPMTKEELPQAVRYEARQHIPLPLGEVALDWQIIEGEVDTSQKKTKLQILLVAVPNEIINQYKEIAQLCGLQLLALEAEVFGLIRALVPADNKKIISLIDIGAQSTTCSIVGKRILKESHSFDFAGNEFIDRIAKSLSVDYSTAKNFKEKYGLSDTALPHTETPYPQTTVKEIIQPLVDTILREIERIIRNYPGPEIEKFIIGGGEALLPGLKEYFQEYLKKEVEIANPFANIFYPPILEKNLKEMGPSYTIAIGMALRGLE